MLTTRYAVLIRLCNTLLPGDPVEDIKDITPEVVNKCLNNSAFTTSSIGELLTQHCAEVNKWLLSNKIQSEWRDGTLLCELLEKEGVQMNDWKTLPKLKRIKLCLKRSKELKIPKIISAEEIMLCNDDVPVMLFISLFRNKEIELKRVEASGEHVEEKILVDIPQQLKTEFFGAKNATLLFAQKLEKMISDDLTRKGDKHVSKLAHKSISMEFNKRKSISNTDLNSPRVAVAVKIRELSKTPDVQRNGTPKLTPKGTLPLKVSFCETKSGDVTPLEWTTKSFYKELKENAE
ncbi:hypothetical protein EIN_043760 [Entamoeba invadens IP1]|uniref:Calponin-homology (CH) domain-containing protein n=1 Tax=Entamoeba invadens IP1 TaxID=370355 RepID=A0A0A1U2H9_ENTIV|nr:hypothetical protein EIN_043760 [Entamoeba invadens IP1]ELP86838.1 hypothetical protein EIN_043760 [Entamoeba invadens IP1]|eukprot:XP_004253609.1 hypothetical protein EIN_043760 [Entamoeba invadens IP1]